MSDFQAEANMGLGAAYISSVEVENLQLREALVYAERGWREALDLARKEKEKLRTDQNALEISSLQLELDTVHKKMLASRRKADEVREKVNDTSIRLDNSMEELIDTLSLRKDLGLQEDEEKFRRLNTGDDDETTAYVFKLEVAVKKAETIMALARQAHLAKVAKEEASKSKRKLKKAEGATTTKSAHTKKMSK